MPPRTTIQWNGDEILGQSDDDAVRGLLMAAEYLLGESVEVAPLDEGPLIQSANASVDRATLTSAASYDTPYAEKQHENLHYRHAPGRQAKYLEEPWTRNADIMGRIIATQIRKGLR